MKKYSRYGTDGKGFGGDGKENKIFTRIGLLTIIGLASFMIGFIFGLGPAVLFLIVVFLALEVVE